MTLLFLRFIARNWSQTTDFSGDSKVTPHMPRLADTDYLARHRYLRRMWQEYPFAFAVLKPREQRQLHRYHQTQGEVPDAALIANRQQLTAESPPATRGKQGVSPSAPLLLYGRCCGR